MYALLQIRKYFTNDAWELVENVMKTMKKKQVWLCASCYVDLGNSESIVCESCLDWFHLRCVSMKKATKEEGLVLSRMLLII